MTTTALDQRAVARWRNAIIVAFALGGIAVSTWGPRLPSLRADLGIDNSFLGLILGGVTIGSICGLLSSSPLMGRLGARMAIRVTLWLVSVGVAVIGFGAGALHSVGLTALGFVCVGFGIGAADVMINVEGSAVERAAGRTLMPLMHAAWSAGVIIGSGIGAACAALSVPFGYQFVGEAVLVAVVTTIATAFIPVAAPEEAVEKKPIGERIRAWASGWTDLRLLLIGLVMLGVELGEGSANNWLTLGVRDGHGQPDAIAAAYFTVFAIGETAARVGGGPLVDRVGRVMAIRVTTALGVVGLLFFILGGPAWIVLVGVVLWAVGVSMGFPLGMSAAADSGPNPAARVSVVASIGYIANLGGPPVVGALSESVGLLNALFVIIALLVVGFCCAGALGQPRSKINP